MFLEIGFLCLPIFVMGWVHYKDDYIYEGHNTITVSMVLGWLGFLGYNLLIAMNSSMDLDRIFGPRKSSILIIQYMLPGFGFSFIAYKRQWARTGSAYIASINILEVFFVILGSFSVLTTGLVYIFRGGDI